jgi:hypothetical protein
MSEHIREDLAGNWICLCGNTADHDGFRPYRDGREVEESDPDWNGHDAACRRCGRVVNGWQAAEGDDGELLVPVVDHPAAIAWREE